MTSVLNAIFAGILVPFLHRALIAILGPARAILAMITAFFIAIFAFFLIEFYSFTDPLNPELIYSTMAGCFLLGFLLLGYMEAFSMLCRGFSLTILCEVEQRKKIPLSEVIRAYGGNAGGAWLFKKRMQGLIRSAMVIEQGETIRLGSKLGAFIAWLGLFTKKNLKMGRGG